MLSELLVVSPGRTLKVRGVCVPSTRVLNVVVDGSVVGVLDADVNSVRFANDGVDAVTVRITPVVGEKDVVAGKKVVEVDGNALKVSLQSPDVDPVVFETQVL